MKVIGITGGIGSGKSAIMDYLQEHYKARALKADDIAHELIEPGTKAYEALARILPGHVFLENGDINRPALATLIFDKEDWKAKVNAVVHPAVKAWILDAIAKERGLVREENPDAVDYVLVEAALLIEENYGEICDELWYVYASQETRKKRLQESRGYSTEKIDSIFKSQLGEEEYRKHCQVVIDNDGAMERAFRQIERAI